MFEPNFANVITVMATELKAGGELRDVREFCQRNFAEYDELEHLLDIDPKNNPTAAIVQKHYRETILPLLH